MLSYKHIFHAGSFADVHKHLILIALFKHLQKTPAPYTYIDTHSGSGIYDLASPAARKTGEYLGGIEKIKGAKEPMIVEYLALIYKLNGRKSLRYYPGSPEIATLMARPNDVLHFCELHNNEFQLLKSHYQNYKNTFVHHMNGFEYALKTKLQKGLVLIDPPYEVKSDYRAVVATVKKLPKRLVAVWYPMLQAERHVEMVEALQKLGNAYVSEIRSATRTQGMYGAGMVIINGTQELVQEIKEIEQLLAAHGL